MAMGRSQQAMDKSLRPTPGRLAQSVARLTQEPGVPGSIPSQAWRKYAHVVLVNCFGGLNLPGKSVVRLTDRLDITIAVYHGRKITKQQQKISEPHLLLG